ncbi:MAG: ComEC/Rec2 family competence protein, partial [Clostridia bacterium]
GDRSFLDAQVDNDTRASGLTHIFSVSGLHVAFLASAVFFGLRLLKVNKKVSLIIISALIFVYGIMTGFPPSLVRAGIMLIILIIAQLSFRRFDPLSALALAAIAILIFRPLYIFELGFQMSVTAMLGIFCFYQPLKRFFDRGKGKLSNFVSSSLAMSLSANSFLIAIIFNTFTFFGIYFCLGNIIVIPFIGLTYSLLMFITLLSLFIPPAAALMIIPRVLITVVIEVSAFIAALPFASLRVYEMGIFAVIYVLTMLFMSKFLMVEKQRKLTALMAIIGFSAVLMLVL